jgi:hypothetical protein
MGDESKGLVEAIRIEKKGFGDPDQARKAVFQLVNLGL